jgi:hypothetical protein
VNRAVPSLPTALSNEGEGNEWEKREKYRDTIRELQRT